MFLSHLRDSKQSAANSRLEGGLEEYAQSVIGVRR